MTIWTRAKRLTTLGVALAVATSMLAGPAGAAYPAATAQSTRTSIIAEINPSIIAEIKSLIPTLNGDADKKLTEAAKKLTEAAKKLTESQNEKYWSGPDKLSKEGTKVFEKDRDAAKKLREAVKKLTEAGLDPTEAGSVLAEAGSVLARLVAEDQRLAAAMITAAKTAGASDSKIEEALKEMAKAKKELADGKPHDAIDHFKKAWEKAFKAEAEALKAAAEAAAEAAAATAVTATASTGGGGDYAVYTFWFVNETVQGAGPFAVTGTNESGTYGYTGRGNEGYLEVDGVKMQLHVSCSDAFTDGTGDKSDPTEASAYLVVNYTISKYKDGQLDKTCNLTGVEGFASISLEMDYRIEGSGVWSDWKTGNGEPVTEDPDAEGVQYRLTVTNSGSLPLTGISVTDPMYANCVFADLTPAMSTLPCETDWFSPDPGLNPNTATVTAGYAGGTVSASDSAAFLIPPD